MRMQEPGYSAGDCDVPLELIEQLISEAKAKLGHGAAWSSTRRDHGFAPAAAV